MKKTIQKTAIKRAGSKKVTLEDLAMMVANGFEKTATKDELLVLEKEMRAENKELHNHLDRIEHVFIRAHNNRIEKLEDDMRVVKTMLEKLTHGT